MAGSMDLSQMMAMMQGGGPGGASAASSAPLFSCKAGKCVATPVPGSGNFKVAPEKARGTLSVERTTAASAEGEGLLHLLWEPRKAGGDSAGDDVIMFPNEAEFSRVDTGKGGERVFLLQYKSSERRFFYWMQDL